MTELEQLRQTWKSTIHGDGGKCPCCDRFGKLYSRTINKTMATALKWLVEQNQQKGLREWIDVPNTAPPYVLRGYQLTTLRWWGLVERELPDPKVNKKHSGHWRATLKGIDFVEGRVEVPRKAYHYDGDAVGFSDDQTGYEACLKRKFDYDSTMTETHHAQSKEHFGAIPTMPVGGTPVGQVAAIVASKPEGKSMVEIQRGSLAYMGKFDHRGIFKNAPV